MCVTGNVKAMARAVVQQKLTLLTDTADGMLLKSTGFVSHVPPCVPPGKEPVGNLCVGGEIHFIFPKLSFSHFELLEFPFLTPILPLKSACTVLFSHGISTASCTYLHISSWHDVDRIHLKSPRTQKSLGNSQFRNVPFVFSFYQQIPRFGLSFCDYSNHRAVSLFDS